MPLNDTQPPVVATSGRGTASIIDIGEALRRKRSRSAAAAGDETGEALIEALALQPGAVVGYFRHADRCMQVRYAAAECLWLYETPYTPDIGPLPDFYAFNRLKYAEFGQVTWPMRTLQFTYLGTETEPSWMPLPSASVAEMLRKVFGLYDNVTKGAPVHASDDLVPNPVPPRYDPNRKVT